MTPVQVLAVVALLEAHTGLRAPADSKTLRAALEALMLETGWSAAQTVLALREDTALLERLALGLTIPETHFFRVKPQMEALEQIVLPDLARLGRTVTMWSAGCSTGEEAYTLAILAQGHGALRGARVLGTDLHPGSLEVARAGRYGAWSFRDTPEAVREAHFTALHGGQWQVSSALRASVQFEALNLLREDWGLSAPFDLIVCRNVMIYFSGATAQGLIERFAAALRPGGWLILGPSDPAPLAATVQRARLQVRFEGGAMLYRKLERAHPNNARLNPPQTRASGAPPSAQAQTRGSTPRQTSAPTLELPAFLPDQDIGVDALRDGLHALERADVEGAVTALRRAVYLEPHSALPHFALAQALLSSGQHARARVALREAERLIASLSPEKALAGTDLTVADLQRGVQAMNVMLNP